jgi:hypothetical protein
LSKDAKHSLTEKLSLTAGKKVCQQVMLRALRPLSYADGIAVINAIKHAIPKVGSRK